MALTEKEQFRLGFLACCAELGLTPDEVRENVKVATTLVKEGAYGLGDLLGLYWKIPLATAAYGLASSAGIGALGGHVAAKMTEQEVDPNEAKRQELLAVYRQQAERARRNAARIRYRQPKPAIKQPELF